MAVRRQVTPDIFTTMFGVGENNRAIRPLFFQQRLQQAHFFFVGRIEQLFFNTVARFLLRLNFDVLGVVHLFERQFTDAIRKGGREQHVQALIRWRHTAEQPTDIFNKAEIVHAIGFVKHDNLNGAEVNMVLFGVVDKATGGTDQNIHAAFQHFQLLIVAVAAVSQAEFQTGSLRQRFGVSVDLNRQFTRRRHDQRARLVDLAVSDRRVSEKIMKR